MGLHERTIYQIAREEDMSPQEVEKIVNSQFDFVLHTIQKDEAARVRLTYLGKFETSEKYLAKYREQIAKKYGTS